MGILPRATNSDRHKHDIAYLCFIPPGLVFLAGSLAAYVPMSTGTAGGIGFLVLIPLTLASLYTVPKGMYFAVSHRRDFVLIFLSVTTILMVVQLILELGSVGARNATGLVYGAAVLLSVGSWFFIRRRAYAA